MQFIDLKTQLEQIRPAIDKRIAKVLDHGQFIMGPEVFELEEQLAEYVGVKHCISCANGTDALQLSLMALGIGPGDTVITTAFSFFATAEVIPLVGATPYFVDIDPSTYNLSPISLEQGIKDAIAKGLNPKAVIAVDLFGLPANYPEIEPICEQYDLHLIEDAAQGFGGSINDKKAGSFGDIATTSFFPAKPLGCYGDGGAIFTNNDELADLCQSLRIHGKGKDKYDNIRIGMNSRLDTIQAAILLEKLLLINAEQKARAERAAYYHRHIPCDLITPQIPSGFISAWAQYSVRCAPHKRADLISNLTSTNFPSAIYYPLGLHQQRAFELYSDRTIPQCELLCKSIFSLPIATVLTEDNLENICQILGQ